MTALLWRLQQCTGSRTQQHLRRTAGSDSKAVAAANQLWWLPRVPEAACAGAAPEAASFKTSQVIRDPACLNVHTASIIILTWTFRSSLYTWMCACFRVHVLLLNNVMPVIFTVYLYIFDDHVQLNLRICRRLWDSYIQYRPLLG